MKLDKDLLLMIIALTVGLAVIFVSFCNYLDTPILVKSHTTKKCLYWEDTQGKHDCSVLPSNYELVWGE